MSIYELLAQSETNVKFFEMLGRLQRESMITWLDNAIEFWGRRVARITADEYQGKMLI